MAGSRSSVLVSLILVVCPKGGLTRHSENTCAAYSRHTLSEGGRNCGGLF